MAKDNGKQPRNPKHPVPERPRLVPRTPTIEKMIEEIKAHGFDATYRNSHQGWLIREVSGEIRLEGKYLEGENGLYAQWREKIANSPAAAPAPIETEPEKEEEVPPAAPQEMAAQDPDLEIVDIGDQIQADPNTGQQFIPNVPAKLPKGLARVVVDEYYAKEKFVPANNDYQNAIKARQDEIEKPIYASFFQPVPEKFQPKNKKQRIEFLQAGHVVLQKTTTRSDDVSYSVMHASKCEWLKKGADGGDKEAAA